MKNITRMVFFLGATFLLGSTGGQTTIPPQAVNHAEFHARHPEALPHEGVTGRRVGCSLYDRDCATKKRTTKARTMQ